MTNTELERRRLFAWGLRTGGLVALAIGAAHFLLMEMGYDAALLESIPDAPRDHFAYLGTYAIGLFLVNVGVMSLYFSKSGIGTGARVFAAGQVVFWAARIALELAYPARLRIFFLDDPPLALVGASAVALAGYGLALACSLGREHRRTAS
jgi:hypothetical protein